MSIAAAVLRNEPTGCSKYFNGDVMTTAKKDLQAGDILDGEGGYTAFGRLAPAALSLQRRALPLGLAHKAKMVRPVAKGETITWDDVEVDESLLAVQLRRQLEHEFSPALV